MPAMQAHDDAGADALARRLAGVHLGLAHARDELELLAAVVRAVEPYGPVSADLHHLHVDEHGAPIRCQPIALWTPDAGVHPHTHAGQRIDLAGVPLSEHWIAAPDHALVVTDVTADPRCDDGLRALMAPLQAIVVLPLRGGDPPTWQGMVTLHWAAPHTPGPDERLVYRLLMHTLAAFIADRRALAAHAAALAEIQALYRLSARINEAQTPAELLAAVVDEARFPGAQGKLLSIETGPSGQPESLIITAVYGGGPAAEATLGVRYIVAELPSTRLWLDSVDTAGYIRNIADDPRVDEVSRRVHLRNGLVSAVLLPLRWRGRWLGLLQVAWAEPRDFTDEERRLYASIGPQLAAVLDNRLLAARTEQALAENREQARTLEIVLDHLPIGVMINDMAAGQRRVNRAGAELLADDDPDGAQPIPLYHPDSETPVDARERLSRRAVESGDIVHSERDLLGPDGVRRRLSVTAAPVRDETGRITGAVTLFHDVTHHVAAERERAELQDAVIAAQRAALAERATPLIPISDEILVLPIVGSIDPERGRQIVDTLAHLTGHTRARVVLLDLTGVRDLDDASTRALAQAAATLRLRGTTPIFTGLGPAAAWSLVEQNIDLQAPTYPTLRAALAELL
jgi:PAS domain S-box-containing protein